MSVSIPEPPSPDAPAGKDRRTMRVVVIAVVAAIVLMAAIAAPFAIGLVRRHQEISQRAECAANLRNISKALEAYMNDKPSTIIDLGSTYNPLFVSPQDTADELEASEDTPPPNPMENVWKMNEQGDVSGQAPSDPSEQERQQP